MNRSRKYNLEAVFSARNEASDTLAKVRKDIDDIADALQKLGALKSDPRISLGGDKEAQAGAKATKAALRDVAGTYKARIRLDKDRGIEKLKTDAKLLNSMFDRTWQLKLQGRALQSQRAQLSRMQADLRNMFGRTYQMSIDPSQSEAARRTASRLADILDDRIAKTHEVKMKVDGLVAANAKVTAFDKRLQAMARDYEIDITVDRNRSALSRILQLTDGLRGLHTNIGLLSQQTQTFTRGIYTVQQSLYAFRAAAIAVAVAAAGPLLSGLTILGTTLVTVAGGFGLVAAAAIPLVQAFSQQEERANAAKTATSELSSAQETAANAAQSYKSALDAVDSAQLQLKRTQQAAAESIADSEEALGDARDEVTTATNELRAAEQDLQAVRRDEPLRQKEAELDLADARDRASDALRDYNKAVKEHGKNSEEATDALRDYERAQLDLKQTERDVQDLRKNGSEELQSAKEAVKTASKQEQDAREGVKDAEEDVIRARRDAKQSVLDARRAVAEADKQAKLAAAELAKAQQEVIAKEKAMASATKPLQNGLKQVMAAVKGVQQAYNTHFRGAQRVVNRLALRTLGVANQAMPALGATAEQTALRIEAAFLRAGQEFNRFGARNSFFRILRSMPAVTGRWTSAFARFGQGFLNIMGQAMPYVRQFSRFINRTALDFLKWTNSEKGRRQIQRFFEAAGPVARALYNAVRRIAGALLSWSVKNPRAVANAISTLAGAAFFAFKWIGKLLLAAIKFGQQHPRIAKIAVVLFAVGVAVNALSPALLAVGLLVRHLGPLFVRAGAMGVGAAARTGLAWLATKSVWFAVGAGLVQAFLIAYREIINMTVPTVRGLVMMWNQKKITFPQTMNTLFRTAFASILRMGWQAFQGIVSIFRRLPIIGRLFDGLIKGLEPKVNQMVRLIEGETARAAREMAKNTKQGTNQAGKELAQLAKESKSSLGQAAKNADMSTNEMKLAMRKNIEDGSKSGQNSLKTLLNKGSGYNKQLLGSSQQDFKKMMDAISSNTGGAKTKGLANLLGLKNTGGKHMFDLQSKSSSESKTAKENIAMALSGAKSQGVSALVELNNKGATAMGEAQQRWVDSAWNAAVGMTAAMNAILKGMGKFIEEAGIKGVKKPGTIPLQGKQSDTNVSGTPRGTHNFERGRQARERNARGNVHKFAMGGRNMAPVGGVAQGTTRVFGEVPGTTEFYITDNPRYRRRNIDILRAANDHMMEGDPGAIRLAKGRIYSSGQGSGIYGPTANHLWDKATLDRAHQIINNFKVSVNTYANHPPGYPQYAQSSIDSWDYAGRGTPIGYPSPHNEVKNFIESKLTHGLKWTLGEGDAGHSGSQRHVHATWEPNGKAGSGGFTGGSYNAPDYSAMFDRLVPSPKDLGSSVIANVADAILIKLRSEAKDMLLAKTPGQPGKSPYTGGGSLDEWIRQGLMYGAAFDASSANVNAMRGRAMQESGGNPNAINDWDSNAAKGTPSKGLFQIIEPTWESYRKAYGADAGPFDKKWMDPVMSTAVASRYMKGEYGHIVGASGTGYARGGIHKGMPVSMSRRMENAFLAVADVLRNFTSKGEGLAVGDGGGVGSGRHPVAITNEAGPEAIVPLRRKTREGRYALAVANRAYHVPGFAAGGIVKQGWNLVGSDGKLGIGGPAAGDVLQAAKLWSGAGVAIGSGSDVNATYASGMGGARTSAGGSMSMNPEFRGTPVGFAMWAHEVGHALGAGHSSVPAYLMSNPVMAGDRPASAEIAGVRALWGGPQDVAEPSGGKRSGTTGGGGGGGGGGRMASGGGGGGSANVRGLFARGGQGGGSAGTSGGLSARGGQGGGQAGTSGDARAIADAVERAVGEQTKHLGKKLDKQLGELRGSRQDLKTHVPRLIGNFIKNGMNFNLENDPDTRRHVKAGQDKLDGVKRLAGRN